MTSPAPGGARTSTAESTSADRRMIARKWAYLVSLTAYMPLPHAEIERELLDLVDRLFDAMTSEPLPTDRVGAVGVRLVELHCVGTASLQTTVDVLAGAMLSAPELRRLDRIPERVAHLLGALASGYVEAIRSSTMEQQDNLHRALLEAMWLSERRLAVSEARLDEVLTCSTSGIAITDLDGRFVRVNAAFGRILDRASDQTARASLFDLVRPRTGLDLRGAYRELHDGKLERLALGLDLPDGNGETVRVSLAASLLRHADGQPSDYVTIVVDQTEPAVLRGQLDHQLRHDLVTGLPNRQHFTARLEHVLRTFKPTTLYELELDGFSLLTNGFGREFGDDLLRAVAQRLLAVVAETEEATLAHLDGGTFAILVESSPAAPDTVTMIKEVNRALSTPVTVGSRRVPVSASIGVAHQLCRDLSPSDLLNAGDLALRRAKRRGCGQWAVFDPARDSRDRQNLALTAAMPAAWDDGQLRVVYRPVVHLADDHVLAIEALLRWDHPDHGSIPHHRCQELAEPTGLILPLGSRLLRRACEQLQRRRDLPLHVNLTANQSTDRDLVDRVMQALDATGAAPARLHIGMPVAALRSDHGAADNLRGLTGAGIRTAVHTFTGTPDDLACLQDLTVHMVRMAPSLTHRQTGQNSLLTKAIPDLVALIHSVAPTVIVDDLSTKPAATWWRDAGADAATGPVFPRGC